jgi:thioredoxin reductase (NADPH)
MHSDIAIIGGGPAGLTAGLYAARGGASVTLYEELFPGGQIAKTRCKNYPGFRRVVGYEVGSRLQKQAEKFGLKVEYAGATDDSGGKPKRILLPDREDTAKAVFLAWARTRVPRHPARRGNSRRWLVFATCDGAFFKEKAVRWSAAETQRFRTHCIFALLHKRHGGHRRVNSRGCGTVEKAKQCRIFTLRFRACGHLIGECCVQGWRSGFETTEQRVLPVSGVSVAVGIPPQSALVKASSHE